jgi:hypothetical protein
MDNRLIEDFRIFAKEFADFAKSEGAKAATSWPELRANGSLTRLIKDTFCQFEKITNGYLFNDRHRRNTLTPSFFELFVGKFAKGFFEAFVDREFSVHLDQSWPSERGKRPSYPDILIKEAGKPVSIIELKFHLKSQKYQGEKTRRVKFFQNIPTLRSYLVLQYQIWEEDICKWIIEDQDMWVYILNFGRRYPHLENWDRLECSNPVESLLDFIVSSQTHILSTDRVQIPLATAITNPDPSNPTLKPLTQKIIPLP